METEEIRQQLITGLKNTTAETVHIGDVSQVIEVLGVAKTEKLAIYCNNMAQAPAKRLKPNSAIKQEKVVQNTGVAGFRRLDLLKELENAGPKDLRSSRQTDSNKASAPSRSGSSTSTKNSADPATGS